jgi:hypothetical protein
MNKELLEKYRDINVVDTDWYEAVYEWFTEDMAAIGIEVKNIYFSGFWCQGDGACFEGSVVDWGKFLPSIGYDDHVLIDHAREYWTFSCVHNDRYYHEYSTEFRCYLPVPRSYINKEDFIGGYSPYMDSFLSHAWYNVLSQYSDQNFSETIADIFRGYMRDLYHKLEAEYECLTSDEAVWETIEEDNLNEVFA